MVLATRAPIALLGVAVVLVIGAAFTEVSPALNTLYEDYIGAVIAGLALAAS